MKRRMVGAGGVVLVVALAGIGIWYLAHVRSSEAEQARALEEYEIRRQPVGVSFTVTPPPNTPEGQVLYLSGSVPALGNWDAAGVPLARGEDGKHHVLVPDLLNGHTYEFKITRGTWGTVETAADGKEIANRTFTASNEGEINVVVGNWNDEGKATPGRVTMTGNVVVHKNAFTSSLLGNLRTLVVYLPPDYEANAQQRYPVLYLQDGQNLFDEATSFQGIEWKLDEAAQKLIASGQMKPAIIVGVFNSEQRTPEFTPPFATPAASKEQAPKEQSRGEQYAQMLVREVKPFIDQRYRTLSDRGNTLIGGGSMGGLIALYAARAHNDVFGRVVALSPWLRLADKPLINDLIGDGNWLKQTPIYLDMGTNPGHNYPGGAEAAIADADAFVAQLEKAGLRPGEDFEYHVIEGGKHNEASWQATAEQVLLAIFGTPQPASPTTAPAPAPAPEAPASANGR